MTPRPFDRARDGIVVGEAAAVFVLEDRAHAEARGAEVLGELTGYATNGGYTDLTGISTRQVARCMTAALADAEVRPNAIDCVFAHASGMVRAMLSKSTHCETRTGRPVVHPASTSPAKSG